MEKHVITAVADRLRSPHADLFLSELMELLGRYSAEYVFIDGVRRYAPRPPYSLTVLNSFQFYPL